MRKRILVVDDEKNVRILYRQELSDEGYDVVLAASADEALTQVEKHQPDLITLDIKMPGKSGLAVLRELRLRYRQIPIILCSAYGEYKQNFQTWAADAYVVKSADFTELKETIRHLLFG